MYCISLCYLVGFTCGACVCTAAALLAHSANNAFMRTTLACSLCKYEQNGKSYMENETVLQFFSMSSLQFHITVEFNSSRDLHI